ncbi:MAG TPA: sigma-70 family RNA polymerase sigma factor [Thermoanaerobaculia bacterium]|nr:sigma-70 family RNA polymerase sigma factor [Thermoanaerobaculia bacterium]
MPSTTLAGTQAAAGLPALAPARPEPRRAPAAPSERERHARLDAHLMAEVREGRVTAFEQIVDRHKQPLVSYLARLTHCRERAEEYAQEAFLRLYQSADRYHERGLLSAYLFRIATNLVRSDERRRKRWRLLSPFLDHDDRAREPSPQRTVLDDEATGLVAAAIRDLPLAFRAPLVLREIEGWTYEEIAEALGCRIGTVKSRIHRAKAQLRSKLEGYWRGEPR